MKLDETDDVEGTDRRLEVTGRRILQKKKGRARGMEKILKKSMVFLAVWAMVVLLCGAGTALSGPIKDCSALLESSISGHITEAALGHWRGG